MMIAEDVMTSEVLSVKKDTPVREAIELMLIHQIAGLPVVNDDMRLVGIITEKDVIKLYKSPDEGQWRTVEEFMTTPAVHFEQDERFEDICECLIRNDFRRVPVLSNGKLVGIVSRPDVAEQILELICKTATHK
ncbi:MAG: CBS domain-containing protein [Planctomycetota bacterium]|jgi:CBS domain-containing protein